MATQVETQRAQIEHFDEEVLRGMYLQMRRIREFEKKAGELADAGEIPGPIHLYIGQEAVAVGSCLALRDDDIIGSTHRGHGHVLAKGADVRRMMAELAGKESGLNRGRGGSMHMVDFSKGIFGCNAIVGASVPHVTGGILSSQMSGDDRVGIAFFGDGAINEGVVLETMNMAAIWDLPVVFLCENNQYSVTTSVDYAVAGEQISERAEGFGISGETINGQNVLTVNEAVEAAISSAREDNEPQFIECETYRYKGHFLGEEEVLSDRPYRDEGEIETWRSKDPLETFSTALEKTDVITGTTLDAIDEDAREEMEEAAEFAINSDFPEAKKARDDVYANQEYPDVPAPKYR